MRTFDKTPFTPAKNVLLKGIQCDEIQKRRTEKLNSQ